MIHKMMLAAAGGNSQLLMTVLTTLGLTTNLEVCLDAGDPASYTSGQSWLDRSGNGFDFFLGETSGSEASDPTFTGAPNSPTNYWSFDGGDFFRYDTTNETWMENLHKNNAVFTIVKFVYIFNSGSVFGLCGDSGTSDADIGIAYQIGTAETQSFVVRNTTASPSALSVVADNALGVDRWHMVALSLNEATGAGGGFFYADGNYDQVAASDTFNSTYTSPSSLGATFTFEIASVAGSDSIAPSGERHACLAIWEGTALTKANLDTIFSAMRGRFGI